MTTFGDRLYQFGGAPVGGDLLGLLGKGNVWYVDPLGGSDGAKGNGPARAFKTLQHALDRVSTSDSGTTGYGPGGRADVIIRLPGNEEVSAVINADVGPNVTIVAATAGQSLFGDRLACYTSAAASYTTGPVLDIMYRNISLYGLAFSSRATYVADNKAGSIVRYTADSAVTGMQTGGGGQFFTVRNCLFRDGAAGSPGGLWLEGAGPAYIYQNQFGYANAALAPGCGIVMHGSGTNNCTDIDIDSNLFLFNTAGIKFDTGMVTWCVIRNNHFVGTTDDIHWGASGDVTGGAINGNYFHAANDGNSWQNELGSGDTVGNIFTDTAMTMAGNYFDPS